MQYSADYARDYYQRWFGAQSTERSISGTHFPL
jgi:hypothetical protein